MADVENSLEEAVDTVEAPEPERGETATKIRITVRRLDRLDATLAAIPSRGLSKIIS